MNNTTQNNNNYRSNCTQNPDPRETSLINIINSIANEENALACILSAECAKINTILAVYNDSETLLAINTSVQGTIELITTLEGVLQAKLNAILAMMNEEE